MQNLSKEKINLKLPFNTIRASAYKLGNLIICSICVEPEVIQSFNTTDTFYTLKELGLPGPSIGEAIAFWQHPQDNTPVASTQIIDKNINFRKFENIINTNRPTCQIMYVI